MQARTLFVLSALLMAVGSQAVQAQQQPQDDRYIVKFRDPKKASDDLAMVDEKIEEELTEQSAKAMRLTLKHVEKLRKRGNVLSIEVDGRRYPLAQSQPYGIAMIQADNAVFNASNASSGVTVCIIDSGYQIAHEDLQDANVTGTNDPGTGNWYEDSCGHGSHVAGTIAALNNTTGVVGVNKNGLIRLHIEKVFNGSACGWAYSSDLIAALNRCRNAVAGTGQKLVVSMSLGGPTATFTEQDAFQVAYDAGVLSVAAAGNSGTTSISYPAGYPSVISVAAVDSTGTLASFSQRNSDVELAAPGVDVLSTEPFRPAGLGVGTNLWTGSNIDGAARTDVSGALVDGGLCDTIGAWTGKVVLCQRGTNTFAQKVANVQAGGAAGAVVYNNVAGTLSASLGGTSTIPAIAISQIDGQAALVTVGQLASLTNAVVVGNGYYDSWSGTSMATPHVSGAAALIWSLNLTKTNAEVRTALQNSALDKGTVGRDTSYGYGLIQAKAANDYLANPTPPPPPPPPPASITLSVTKVLINSNRYARLVWANATGTQVDYYRGTSRFRTANDGTQDDGRLNPGTYTYKVCNAGSTTACSNSVTITY